MARSRNTNPRAQRIIRSLRSQIHTVILSPLGKDRQARQWKHKRWSKSFIQELPAGKAYRMRFLNKNREYLSQVTLNK